MKPEDPGSEVLEIGINKGHVGHLSGLRLGLESEVFMLDICIDMLAICMAFGLDWEKAKWLKAKDPGK